MAVTLSNVDINSTGWTVVLEGEGFVICNKPVLIAFNDTTPTSDIRGLVLPAHTQCSNITGKVWASVGFGTATVTPTLKD